ncbi:MAG: HAD-IIA family hydrolase [Candidatus Anstonellaceae archaeon]
MKSMSLSRFKNIIFDLDGVVYLGDKLIDGIAEAIDKLRKNNFNIFFLTNNATKSRKEIATKLNSLGLNQIKESEIFSSAYAAAYLAFNNGFNYAFVVGEEGLKEEVRNFGIKLLEDFQELQENSKTCLISGLDRNFNYSKLKQATRFLLGSKNRKWIACNLDPNYPVEDGIDPGAGSLAASIAFSVGNLDNGKMILRYPDFIVGKPSLFILDLLFKKSERKSCIFIGDRLDVDIPFAKKGGLFSVLVLSGISKKEDLKKYKIKPDLVLEKASLITKFLELDN